MTIDSFGEEIYISDGIMSIIEDDGHLYFMERKMSGIIKTDKDLNPLTVFGRKGRGPGASAKTRRSTSKASDTGWK